LGSCALLAACSADHSEPGGWTELKSAAPTNLRILAADEDADDRAYVPPEYGCGAGALTSRGANGLARWPYLQRTSDNSVSILFTTRSASDPAPLVELRSRSGQLLQLAQAVRDPAAIDGAQHAVTFEGLAPDTEYCYALTGWTKPTSLRTAPPAGSDVPVRFLAFGDSGDGGDGQLALRDQMAALPFELLLHTGDVAYEVGSLAALEQTFFGVYKGFLKNTPAFPASGNHDYQSDDAAPFRQVFALPENGGPLGLERWYSFDFGDVHFVALDTQRDLAAQVTWLEQDLSRNQRPWTIAYLHRPPFSSGRHGSSLDVREAFVPLFERHGVQLVLAGHEHDYERTVPLGGVTYVVTGGGGKTTRPVGTSDFTAFSAQALHFVQGTVTRDSLELVAIDIDGQQLDSVLLAR
jgi:hypothetical protein